MPFGLLFVAKADLANGAFVEVPPYQLQRQGESGSAEPARERQRGGTVVVKGDSELPPIVSRGCNGVGPVLRLRQYSNAVEEVEAGRRTWLWRSTWSEVEEVNAIFCDFLRFPFLEKANK